MIREKFQSNNMRQPPQHVVSVFVTSRKYSVNIKKIGKLTNFLLDHFGLGPCEVSLGFVGPKKMQALNHGFRMKDKSTDVLSFPQCEWRKPVTLNLMHGPPSQRRNILEKPAIPGPLSLGDIVISLVDAEKNAHLIGQGLDREVCFLIVHGLLHLCGHDHLGPQDERRMLKEQHKAMGLLDQLNSQASTSRPKKRRAVSNKTPPSFAGSHRHIWAGVVKAR
jgi:probable rRNA maturation factor